MCSKNGMWEYPDYSICVRVELQTVNEQVCKHLRDEDEIHTFRKGGKDGGGVSKKNNILDI